MKRKFSSITCYMKKYVFKPYNKNFPDLFAREKKRITTAIQECVEIQHVGSTAIPGLGGKGIIDIAIAINTSDVDEVSRKLKKLGYEFRENGSTSERLFFRIDLPDEEEKIRRYHVHLTFLESSEWKDLLLFRDYLRSHPEAVMEYAKLKKKAAEQIDDDGVEYRKQKDPFFKVILVMARI